jgi:hypothetical protein
MTRTRILLALVWLAGACTSASPSATILPSSGTSGGVSPAPAIALADGTPLPEGCDGHPVASQTIAFVADGRAWALDPVSRRLDCMFEVADPGAFAWGPQGDRVLLGGSEVRGLTREAPTLPALGGDPSAFAFDWGHPIGLAVVFADETGAPFKRFMDDGRVEPLSHLPKGSYLQIAYHPSGLALGLVLERNGNQSIWLSTNEGRDPSRLVFSEEGTTFTSIAFSPDGQRLWWIAQHAAGYPEVHAMDLGDRSGFTDEWTGDARTAADALLLSPNGRLVAMDQGSGCADRLALVLAHGSDRLAMPAETRPTAALGWLDRSTVLVAAGGCDEPVDLFAVPVRASDPPVALVRGVDVASPRTVLTHAPDSVPEPASADGEAPPGGVG